MLKVLRHDLPYYFQMGKCIVIFSPTDSNAADSKTTPIVIM
jgi:hypothetical protein